MQTKTTSPSFSKIYVLAVYQILGGLLGVFLTTQLILSLTTMIDWHLIIFGFAIGLYVYSIFCGVMIFKNLQSGFKHSWINQILQIFNFSIAGYGFQYISGLYLSVGIDLSNLLNMKFNMGSSTWQLIINQDSEINLFNFNIVAVLIVIFIDRRMKRLEAQKIETKLSTIGLP